MSPLRSRTPPKRTRRDLMSKSSQRRAATLPQMRRQAKRPLRWHPQTHKKGPRNPGQQWPARVMRSNKLLILLPRWSSSYPLDSLSTRSEKWLSLSRLSRMRTAKRSLAMPLGASFRPCLAPKKSPRLSLRGPSPCLSSQSI